MAKPAKSESVRDNVHERLRELAGILLFGLTAFVLMAIASYSSDDPGATVETAGNLCGRAGHHLAHRILFWFGDAAYLGIVILFIWSLSLVARRPMVVGPFRILWFGLFVFSSAALLSQTSRAVALPIPDRGGLVGFEIAHLFEGGLAFGPWGTRLVLFFLVLTTFMLATDMLLYTAVVALVDFMARRRAAAATLVARTGPMFRSILTGGDSAGTKPLRTPRPRTVATGVRDEDIEGPVPTAAALAAKAVEAAESARRTSAGEPVEKGGRQARREEVRAVIAAAEAAANEAAAQSPRAAGKAATQQPEIAAKDKRSRKANPPDPTADAAPNDLDADSANAAPAAPDAITAQRESGAQVSGDAGDGVAAGPEPDATDGPVPASDDEPAMLDSLPEAEVVPEPLQKKQATIRLEPPRTKAHRPAGFQNERTEFVAPASDGLPNRKNYRYEFPSTQLLERPIRVPTKEFQKMIEHNIQVLESALASYKVEAHVEEIQKGPVITMFELQVVAGTRVDRIRALEDDLAIRLKAPSVRIVAPIPGKSTIGIEVPNQIRETVCLRELVEAPEYDSSKYAVPVFLGKDAAGRPLIEDLARMPHLLVAGSTGSGKSVCLNAIIMSILFTRSPDQVQLILIDPKMVELSLYENIPHLMCPVVRDMNRAAQILEWACTKMDERYELLSEVGARNIFSYNKIAEAEKRAKLNIPADDDEFEAKMAFIVIVVDELADLMMVSAKEVENYITRLAQKSRAVGIHIILATQRPSTNVITGLIKANMPTRISFQVASKVDARVVLDQNGAEKLLGFGDMLYLPPRSSMLARGQGAFVADEEIKAVVDAIKTEKPLYSRELLQKNKRAEVDPREVDDLYDDAVRFVCESQRGSASLLQRKFAIGYTRASRLIDLMANDGILGEYRNAQAREVLLTLDQYVERTAASGE